MFKSIEDIVQGDVLITHYGIMFIINISHWRRPNTRLLMVLFNGVIQYWPRMLDLKYEIL